jgi:hypothetical protein
MIAIVAMIATIAAMIATIAATIIYVRQTSQWKIPKLAMLGYRHIN